MRSKYPTQDLEVPEKTYKNWQLIVNLLAKQLSIPAALIMRVHAKEIEVFVSSHSDGNVYHPKEKASLDTGLYCETVMDTQDLLRIPNALDDPLWSNNPDISLGMISYLGLPLSWPTGDIFGTLCVLDTKENSFDQKHIDLLRMFQEIVTLNLSVIYENRQENFLRRNAEGALEKSETYIRTLIDASPDLIWLKNEHSIYLTCNKKFERYMGYPEAKITGKSDYDFIDKKTADSFKKKDKESIKRGKSYVTEEEIIYADDGHKEILETIRTPIYDKNSGKLIGVLGVARDITERKRHEQQIYFQAYYDELTRLPNRFSILDRLSKRIINSELDDKQIALLYIDLDDFKKINDTLGHEFGDQLLVQAADRLKNGIRGNDTAGRLGGDEFIVLVDGLRNIMDVNIVAENLLHKFQAPFEIQGHNLVLTMSLGISIYPDHGNTPSELMKNADTAMYHAKAKGGNTYSYFIDVMNKNIYRRFQIEEHMRFALEKNEFKLHYQPIIEVQSGKIIGVEALLRWRNEKLGDIGPSEFIPIAEQSGIIVSIGKYVLQEALAQHKAWSQISGLDSFKISVNISPKQLRDSSFIDALVNLMNSAKVPASCLELEITEGVLMTGYTEINSTLDALNHLGVAITMDDFGKGYSSLSYARNYPFTTLKIDQEFISDISSNPSDLNLVNGIILIAHGMGLNVTAEGVETIEQLKLLSELSCDYAQGYYISRPVAAESITSILNTSFRPNSLG